MQQKLMNYFIEEKKQTEQVAKLLTRSLLKYSDIAEEFCYWLDNRQYKKENMLIINGYSAEDIGSIAKNMDVSGVYNFMVTLRDNPDRAIQTIRDGFPRK